MHQPVSQGFWRGRRVFITGHTGFKGGWLALLLDQLGAKVTGYALAPADGPGICRAAQVAEAATSIIADIRDCARLTDEMRKAEPEIVFHLAAQPLVRQARVDPVTTYMVNVMGTVHLLEAIRATPSVGAAVVVTSDKVYDNVEWSWAYRETDRLGGKEPYGASKAAAEIIVQSYRNAYFSGAERKIGIATARAGNVIGGGDWAEDRLVPDAMRAFSANLPLMIRNPLAVRPWQHVLEPLIGYCSLAQSLADESSHLRDAAFNFGPAAQDAKPVSWLADELCTHWGTSASWRAANDSSGYEARLLEVDSALARAQLRWTPKWNLTQGLQQTVSWYRQCFAGADMRRETLHQIEAYLGH